MPAAHIAALFAINAIFSGAYLFGKVGVDHFPPLFFSGLRFALSAACLAPFLGYTPALRARFGEVAFFALVMGPCLYGFIYLALATADGTAAILIGTQFSIPISVLIGHFWLREKASAAVWGAIAAVVAGVLVVGFDAAVLGYPVAFALILASAVCYAAANAVLRGLSGAVGILRLNAWMTLAAMPIMFALSAFFESGQIESLRAAKTWDWIAVLYSGVAVTIAGHGGMFWMLRRHPLAQVMPYYVLTPIFGIGCGALFLGETPTLRFGIGAAIALGGIAVVNRLRARALVRAERAAKSRLQPR